MKPTNVLFERIVQFDRLLEAERRAARGKRDRESVARFEFYLERELIRLQAELFDGSYWPGAFYTFEVRDPKPRAICAAPFRDRVLHHALCDVLEPVFERRAIFDSYACRVGKGTHAAIARAQHFARRRSFFLKCDVRLFFASVDHAVLEALLSRLFRDRRLPDKKPRSPAFGSFGDGRRGSCTHLTPWPNDNCAAAENKALIVDGVLTDREIGDVPRFNRWDCLQIPSILISSANRSKSRTSWVSKQGMP